MNLIVNRRLDQQEERAIYELTLKKQRSKKSTASEKHAAAIQRLAEELLPERKQSWLGDDFEANAEDEDEERRDESRQSGCSLAPFAWGRPALVGQERAEALTSAHYRNARRAKRAQLCRCESAAALTTSVDEKQGQANNERLPSVAQVNASAERCSGERATNLVRLAGAHATARDNSTRLQRVRQIDLQRQCSTSTIATNSTASSSGGSSSSAESTSSTGAAAFTNEAGEEEDDLEGEDEEEEEEGAQAEFGDEADRQRQLARRLHRSDSLSGASALVCPEHQRSSDDDCKLQNGACTQKPNHLPLKSISFLSSTCSSEGASSSTAAACNVLSDEASIKLNQLRLEQLNNELERRLHQYEYLVAQEKAILGAYNLNLFTSQGVNNFQRFEVHQKQLHSSHSWSNFQLNQSGRKF